MSTTLNESVEEIVGAVCTEPRFTDPVNSYLDDPLNSPEAEEIEDHLLECRACREFVDTMLGIRGEGARSTPGNDQSFKDRRLARIANYRREGLQE